MLLLQRNENSKKNYLTLVILWIEFAHIYFDKWRFENSLINCRNKIISSTVSCETKIKKSKDVIRCNFKLFQKNVFYSISDENVFFNGRFHISISAFIVFENFWIGLKTKIHNRCIMKEFLFTFNTNQTLMKRWKILVKKHLIKKYLFKLSKQHEFNR